MSRDKEKYNKYQKEYQLKRYRIRLDQAIEKLGGKCVKCGSCDDLQFDHIIPSTKKFVIARLWSIAEDKFLNEVAKCQLLCQGCHSIKTIIDTNKTFVKNSGIHGTLSSYNYCKCQECKAAKALYNKQYKLKKSGKAG